MSSYTWSDLIRAKSNLTNVKFEERQRYLNFISGDQTEHMNLFNRFYIPEAYLYTGGFRGYLFFTRPDCNLMDISSPGKPLRDTLKQYPGFTSFMNKGNYTVESIPNQVNQTVMMQLQHNTGFPSAFMPVFTNTVKGYTPEDQVLDSMEKGDTQHGIKVKYGRHSIASRTSGTITLTFQDTKYFPIYKSIALWSDYIEAVFLGDHSPADKYVKGGILDYAISVYYLVVRDHVDGRMVTEENGNKIFTPSLEIVYWEKLAGLFPKVRPDSSFATQIDNFTYPEFSVQFEYSMKSKSSILDPYVLTELNMLSQLHHNKPKTRVDNHILEYSGGKLLSDNTAEPMVAVPMVEKYNGAYYLSWYVY